LTIAAESFVHRFGYLARLWLDHWAFSEVLSVFAVLLMCAAPGWGHRPLPAVTWPTSAELGAGLDLLPICARYSRRQA
jgi:hypothetical protein